MVTYAGATVKLVIERLLAEGKIQKEFIGVLSGGAVNQDFYTKNFPITHDAGEAGGVTGEVVANAPTDTIFKTDLPSTVDDYYVGMTLRFTSGALSPWEMRVISDYIGATKQITVASAFSAAPSVGDAFIVEPSVDVFTDDETPGSWTEYVEDGTDYVIESLTGKVTVLADENQAGNAGERISISYYTKAEVAVGQNADVNWDGDLTDIHKLGSVMPQELKEGLVTIGGTIGQLYASRDLLGKVIGRSDFYKKLADFSLYIYLDAPEGEIQTGSPYIKVANTKFGGSSLSTAIGAITALDVTYKGLAVSEGTYSP